MNFSYLIIDMIVLIPPVLFSFHPRFPFRQRWKAYWPPILLIAALFLAWDGCFTHLGVWGFNNHYVTGVYAANLPVEELLFFICVPYACLFTGFCWSRHGFRGPNKIITEFITILLAGGLLATAIVNIHRRYTATTFLSLCALLLLCRYAFKTAWLGKFYLLWAVLLLPLLLVDGILTGTGLTQPIVWYNPTDILGVRVLTIPIEDLFYGMELILLNILAVHHWKRKWADVRDGNGILLQ